MKNPFRFTSVVMQCRHEDSCEQSTSDADELALLKAAFHNDIQTLNSLLQSGKLDRITSVTIRFRRGLVSSRPTWQYGVTHVSREMKLASTNDTRYSATMLGHRGKFD